VFGTAAKQPENRRLRIVLDFGQEKGPGSPFVVSDFCPWLPQRAKASCCVGCLRHLVLLAGKLILIDSELLYAALFVGTGLPAAALASGHSFLPR
jgi:hypothetical protein